MDEGKKLIKLALFGQPVKTSLSPFIHRMFADQVELDISYELVDVDPGAFPAALTAFESKGGVGCNITVPLKGDAFQQAGGCTEAVRLAQAANTLVRESGGWHAHNTDGAGLTIDLSTNNGIAINGKRVLVMGAGGATAGILGVLLAAMPERFVLVNRNMERARVLAERFDPLGNVVVSQWADLSRHSPFDVVINATSLGHLGEVPPLNERFFAPGSVCYDLNYGDAGKPLESWCETTGQRYLDGLGMLVEQAAESFSIWTGQRPDSSVVINRLKTNQA